MYNNNSEIIKIDDAFTDEIDILLSDSRLEKTKSFDKLVDLLAEVIPFFKIPSFLRRYSFENYSKESFKILLQFSHYIMEEYKKMKSDILDIKLDIDKINKDQLEYQYYNDKIVKECLDTNPNNKEKIFAYAELLIGVSLNDDWINHNADEYLNILSRLNENEILVAKTIYNIRKKFVINKRTVIEFDYLTLETKKPNTINNTNLSFYLKQIENVGLINPFQYSHLGVSPPIYEGKYEINNIFLKMMEFLSFWKSDDNIDKNIIIEDLNNNNSVNNKSYKIINDFEKLYLIDQYGIEKSELFFRVTVTNLLKETRSIFPLVIKIINKNNHEIELNESPIEIIGRKNKGKITDYIIKKQNMINLKYDLSSNNNNISLIYDIREILNKYYSYSLIKIVIKDNMGNEQEEEFSLIKIRNDLNKSNKLFDRRYEGNTTILS